MRIAVVTPYYKEDEALLRQAHDSVLAQAPDCRHVLVADGHPQAAVDGWDAWHVRLAQCHDDHGDTPRGLGALMAAARGFDAVAFLDADNWYEPDHLASLAALHRETGAAVCTSGRIIHAVDGAVIEADDRAVDGVTFVDTNCLFVTRAAFHLLPLWASLPRPLAAINDRIFWMGVCASGATTAHSGRPTLSYRTFFPAAYRARGLPVPSEATRNPSEMLDARLAWCRLSPREKARLLLGGADAPSAGPRRGLVERIDSPSKFRLDIDPRIAMIEEDQFRDWLFGIATRGVERAKDRPDDHRTLDRIEEIYRGLLRSFPEFDRAIHNLGLALARRGRDSEALALFEQSIRLSPRKAEFHANLAGLLMKMGRLAEAERALDRAAELSPDRPAFRDRLTKLRQAHASVSSIAAAHAADGVVGS